MYFQAYVLLCAYHLVFPQARNNFKKSKLVESQLQIYL